MPCSSALWRISCWFDYSSSPSSPVSQTQVSSGINFWEID
ncbi:uncharacterized protein J3R85_015346 [Psidium guajava]|nr:uncharacterized protein J3R85_015346 [Psidium guajava]